MVKNGLFIFTIIVAIIIVTYKPQTTTLTGEVLYVDTNEIVIDCPNHQPRFKPSDDISYSCTILLNEKTMIEPNEKFQQGQIVSVELVNKTKITTETDNLLAKKIIILNN